MRHFHARESRRHLMRRSHAQMPRTQMRPLSIFSAHASRAACSPPAYFISLSIYSSITTGSTTMAAPPPEGDARLPSQGRARLRHGANTLSPRYLGAHGFTAARIRYQLPFPPFYDTARVPRAVVGAIILSSTIAERAAPRCRMTGT